MKVKYCVSLLLLCLLFFNVQTETSAQFQSYWDTDELEFDDVPVTNAHYFDIVRLTDKKIVNGTRFEGPRRYFSPNEQVTNKQAAVMLARTLQLDLNKISSHRYKDVPANDYAFKSIYALVQLGVYPKHDYFNPDKPMLREEVADVLVKALKLNSSKRLTFNDVPKNDKYYHAINALAVHKITLGDGKGNFQPKATVTRGQFSSFLQRSIDLSQYLNLKTATTTNSKELGWRVNKGFESNFDVNPFGDASELAYFLYTAARVPEDSYLLNNNEYYKSYKRIKKDTFEASVSKDFGFWVSNLENLSPEWISPYGIGLIPMLYYNGSYYKIEPQYVKKQTGHVESYIFSEIQVAPNTYYGLAFDFHVSPDYIGSWQAQQDGFNPKLPFNQWPKRALENTDLYNFYYYVIHKKPFSGPESYHVVYRDRDGFKSKSELTTYLRKFKFPH